MVVGVENLGILEVWKLQEAPCLWFMGMQREKAANAEFRDLDRNSQARYLRPV